jgi:CHASE2 domain-containing sensor protein
MTPPSVTDIYTYARTIPNGGQITLAEIQQFVDHANKNRPLMWEWGDWRSALVLWFRYTIHRRVPPPRRLAAAVALCLASDSP